jgi:sulfide:quinone oxidoreductase
MAKTKRPMKDQIPSGVQWIKDYATGFDTDNNAVHTQNSGDIGYDYLVVAPGIKIDTSLVEGLTEAIDKGVVCSNYTDPEHTWNVIKNFKGGTALFTQPTTPIKCGGAPQKIMYLAEDAFRKQGVNGKTKIVFATNGGIIFGVKPIAKTLMEVVDRKNINLRFKHNLVKVDGEKRIAWYDVQEGSTEHNHHDVQTSEENGLVGIHFDMLHLAPPQTAPDFIRNSNLVNDAGWVEVDKGTLQHKRFNNIFSLGDVAALPTAKTGAAVRKQVPVVIENISRLMASQAVSDKTYNGYSSCPLVTGYGKMVLAEFDYDSNFTPDPKLKQMFISDSSKEDRRLWWLKKYMLPYLYWNKMMKGKDV